MFRWADQCRGGHDKNRRSTDYRHVGQNCGNQRSTINVKPDSQVALEIVQAWYDEVRIY